MTEEQQRPGIVVRQCHTCRLLDTRWEPDVHELPLLDCPRCGRFLDFVSEVKEIYLQSMLYAMFGLKRFGVNLDEKEHRRNELGRG